jgi:hypothetical protein
MSTVPVAASEIPVPEPVPAVVKWTWGYFCSYAGAQMFHSGYSRVLPVSVSEAPGGVSTVTPVLDDVEAVDEADDVDDFGVDLAAVDVVLALPHAAATRPAAKKAAAIHVPRMFRATICSSLDDVTMCG